MKEWTFYELDTFTTLKNFVSEPFIQRCCWQAMIIGIIEVMVISVPV